MRNVYIDMNNYQADIQGQMSDLRSQGSGQAVVNRDLERKLTGLQDDYKRRRAELHETEIEAQRLNAENNELERKKAANETELREIKDQQVRIANICNQRASAIRQLEVDNSQRRELLKQTQTSLNELT